MINVEEYFRKPHSAAQEEAAGDLIDRRNQLRAEWMTATGATSCPVDPDTGCEISGKQGGDGDGGFRTPGSRTGTPNDKPPSSHRIIDGKGAGIDDYDPADAFDTWLDQFEDGNGGNSKLAEYGLYREHPSATPRWCHLTTRAPGSGKRTFWP